MCKFALIYDNMVYDIDIRDYDWKCYSLGEQKIKNRYKWFVNPPKILWQFINHFSKDIHITSLTNSMLSRGNMSIIPLQEFETLNLDELKILISKVQPFQNVEVSETRKPPLPSK